MIIFILLILLAIGTYVVSGNFLHLMLIWNLLLGILPIYLQRLYFKQVSHIKYIYFLLWIFFIPNTFYLITDLIHLQFIEFKTVLSPYESIYILNISPWLEMLNILLFAGAGVILGCYSLLKFSNAIQRKWVSLGFDIGISILISIGMYIGRFLRFNTWDILNIPKIIEKISWSFSIFTIQFVLVFSSFLFIMIWILKYYIRKLSCDKKAKMQLIEVFKVL